VEVGLGGGWVHSWPARRAYSLPAVPLASFFRGLIVTGGFFVCAPSGRKTPGTRMNAGFSPFLGLEPMRLMSCSYMQ